MFCSFLQTAPPFPSLAHRFHSGHILGSNQPSAAAAAGARRLETSLFTAAAQQSSNLSLRAVMLINRGDTAIVAGCSDVNEPCDSGPPMFT